MSTGATPLFAVCHQDHLEVAKLLSSYGASRAAVPPVGTPEGAALLVASRGWFAARAP